jgi:Tfp pilus assembly protein PilF
MLATLALGLVGAACSHGSSTSRATVADLLQAGLRAQTTGHASEAREDFALVVSKDPKNYIAWYDLGVIDQGRRAAQVAAQEYQRAIKLSPNYKPALFNLATLETSRNPTHAVDLYQRLLSLDPNDPNVNFNLGLLLIQEGQTAAGKAHLATALRIDPSLASRLPPGVTP